MSSKSKKSLVSISGNAILASPAMSDGSERHGAVSAGPDGPPSPQAAGPSSAGSPASAGRPDVGRTLRQARRRRRISRARAAQDTGIREQYLKALEENAPREALPSAPYGRYFLRTYAGYLALDQTALVELFDGRDGLAAEPPVEALMERLPSAPKRYRWTFRFLLAASLASLLAMAALRLASGSHAPAPLLLPGSPQAAAPSSGPSPSPRSTHPLWRGVAAALRLTAPCWVQATVDGNVVLQKTLMAGQSVNLNAKKTLALVLGNAAGARLTVNGKAIDTRGPGQVMRLTFRWVGGRVVSG